ncbi:hypothetical protein SDRG_13127 [Saprolegnia diclina VS20]|uniref:Ricin B lectin domain-containing protein n=1 Tax=Saprolegnia diclina (strain VS20) TaxID=1156394 RepID=T0RH18_SAPDV|nr:hypothetical protein SDRG_13127 [Saprolegnia diclina VS20]EQC29097.1 hypothetical protein SDRG_13127 [Saprolegnia diclina VS20]|eukprot:XP_008617432.1 hypothetical protein SDRG_13127 [Saprolegnia diclina VS20]
MRVFLGALLLAATAFGAQTTPDDATVTVIDDTTVTVVDRLVGAPEGNDLPVGKNETLGLKGKGLKDEFPARQWGLQRLEVWTDQYFHSKPLDQWVTVWGGVVNLRCRNCGGGRAWEVMESEGSSSYDMLRNVQDNLCLDAYWSNAAGKPLVHGYQCQPGNINQRWEYSRYNSATMIKHKYYEGWCLLIYPNGDATMANCGNNWNDVHFNFIA